MPDRAKPRQDLCPDPLHQFLKFIGSEKASDSVVLQRVRVLFLDSIVSHCIDKPLPFLLRQEAQFMKALCKAHFWNGAEEQSGLGDLVEETGVVR